MVPSTADTACRARTAVLVGVAAALTLATVRAQAEPAAAPMQQPRHRLGGAATIDDESVNAFGYPAPLLDATERRAFAVGNSFFRQNWVTAPSSTSGRDGLGPLFNARSCSGCHLRDGRSRPPGADATEAISLLIRIGVADDAQPDRPHPAYGSQIQDLAVAGVRPEARVETDWTVVAGEFGDGAKFELARPTYRLTELADGPLAADVVIGPRTAPHLIGLGLLEAIPAASILALADPEDRDGDGVSGRANMVVVQDGEAAVLGRFGWKATQPDVLSQSAAAFVHDIGITSSRFPHEDLGQVQRERIGGSVGAAPEIDDHKLERVAFYARSLAVPAQRRPTDARVVAGGALFAAYGCVACHRPEFVTGDRAFHPAFRGQTIHPYTDLLLHDMGPGLADGKRDGGAGPSEWRTPPLWGIGLFPVVSGHTHYLHDGRARNLVEAVLWHGGEATVPQERFRTATATERDALIAFLQSL